jgi:hypothetical protein
MQTIYDKYKNALCIPNDLSGYWSFIVSGGSPTYFLSTSNSSGGYNFSQLCMTTGDTSVGSVTLNGSNIAGTSNFGETISGTFNANTGTAQGTISYNSQTKTWTATKMAAPPTDKQCVISSARAIGVYFPNNMNIVESYFYDPHAVVSSATLSGYNIATSIPYIYNLYPQNPKEWWIKDNVFISYGARPTSSLLYSATIIFKDGTSEVISGNVTAYDWWPAR